MSKGKKALKIMGIIFGSLIGLFIILYIVLNITFGIQLKNKLAELKAEGIPMTIAEIAPAPVPDAENAATFYNKAFILMTTGEGGEPYIPNKEGGTKNKTIKTITGANSFRDISQWTDEQRKEIPKLINSQEVREIYALLEKGSQKTKYNFNHNYQDTFEMLMPELSYMRDAARLFCVKALLEAESEKTAEASDTLLIGLKISNHLKDEPTLLSQLVRIACDQIIMECIESIADSKGIPSEKAKLIMNELATHAGVEPFIKAMDGERLFGTEIFESILQGKIPTGEGDNWIPIKNPLLPFIKPIFKKDYLCYLTLLSKIKFSYDFSSNKTTKEIKGHTMDEWIPRYCLFTAMLLPALNKVREHVVTHQANIDICRTGLALKMYKAENKAYPENLEGLVPEFLKEVAVDPFSGESLKYSRYMNGFELYSIGPDMQDDYGTPRATKKDDPAYTDYDIVWKSEN